MSHLSLALSIFFGNKLCLNQIMGRNTFKNPYAIEAGIPWGSRWTRMDSLDGVTLFTDNLPCKDRGYNNKAADILCKLHSPFQSSSDKNNAL